MIRLLLPEILLFLVPFAAYFLWLSVSRDRSKPGAWSLGRLAWLAIAGLVLALLGFVALATFSGDPPGSIYVAPRYVDGELVPGHFKRRGDE